MAARTLEELEPWAHELLEAAHVARLGLLDDHGAPRVLPVTFAILEGAVWSAVDHKPKRGGGELARVRWLRARPESALTVDHYDDDWSQLAWVQLLGRTEVLDVQGRDDVVETLAARYPEYRDRPPAGPLLRLVPTRTLSWRARGSHAGASG